MRIGAAFLIGVLLLLPLPTPGAASSDAGDANGESLPGKLRLILPEVIHAVPGIEANVYFDNVVLTTNAANYAFDVICDRGAQQTERWTFTPDEADVGDYPFALEVRDESNDVIARATSTVRVVPSDAGKDVSRSILIIGNSLTAASVYPQHILDLCAEKEGPELRMIGTRGPRDSSSTTRHEGYGGWTAKRFATKYTGIARGGDYKKCGSPFIYEGDDGTPELDFPRYCQEFNDGKGPDFVTLFLGCNDTFSATDENLESRIDTMFVHYDTLIKMIHDFRDDTVIGAILPVPPAATQDAFGVNYKSKQTRWQYRRNQHRLVERMVERYGGRQADRVHLVPAYVNLDCLHNYPSREAPWNARTSAVGSRLRNGVHPSAEGYRQIGDTVFCWLAAQVADSR